MFDQDFHRMQVKRYSRNFASDIIFQEVSNRVLEVMEDMQVAFKKEFQNVLAINFHPETEAMLPTNGSEKYDLIISNLELHYENNIIEKLASYREMLSEGGAIICTLFGGKTLVELRQILEQAELLARGGVSPRVIPMVDVKDAGQLLQMAKYSYAIADLDEIEVRYKNFQDMLTHPKKIGQANAIAARDKRYPGSKFFKEAAVIANTNLKSTYEIVTLSGIR